MINLEIQITYFRIDLGKGFIAPGAGGYEFISASGFNPFNKFLGTGPEFVLCSHEKQRKTATTLFNGKCRIIYTRCI